MSKVHIEKPEETAIRVQALKLLMGMPYEQAMGICCSFLMQCAMDYPVQFRRVMNERVVREGFSGMSLLEIFKRKSQ